MTHLGWFLVLEDGSLSLCADEPDMFSAAARCSTSLAQAARSIVQIDGTAFPCAAWNDCSVVLCRIEDDGSTRILHELPPAPRTGNQDADRAATLVHGALVSELQYHVWLAAHGEEDYRG